MVDPATATAPPAPLDLAVIPRVWGRYTNLVVESGHGAWLVTDRGDSYLDYSSGIAVTSTGHAHPRVVAAIQSQAERLIHGQQGIVYHKPGLALHARLQDVLPGGNWGVFLSNSGAEAVEAAVKLARATTHRPAIIAFRGGFHGRTGQTMALSSSRVVVRGAYEPLPGSVYLTAYPYCYRARGGGHSRDDCTCDWQRELEMLFAQVVSPDQVAAILVEPIMGEAGYVIPPAGFLPRLREIADRHGILLIADEVQTGFGRSGRMFAVEHVGVTPDIVTMGKGIASGLPLSGILARRELMDRWEPGTHGGTYGGNVVACAAALATLDVIEEEDLLVNAANRGTQLLDGLESLKSSHPGIGDVRGIGCMIAIECVRPGQGDGRVPNPSMAVNLLKAALDRRLILLSAGAFGHIVRVVPPLVTTSSEVDQALSIIGEALAEAGHMTS